MLDNAAVIKRIKNAPAKYITDLEKDPAKLTNDEIIDEINDACFYSAEWLKTKRRARNINNKLMCQLKSIDIDRYIRALRREQDSRTQVQPKVSQVK